jgi:hypothetical protein
MTSEDLPVEIVLELPELLKEPATLPNGDLVDIGDYVEHRTFGIGRVYRVATYHDHLGILLCVEYPNGEDRMLCLDVVNKVKSPTRKSP